ncbi:caspase family protein [Dyadobacter sp. CY312]|uniref:caspase family protein n=1 Tax=Dyadobacter sp. CY312 TaxID=2907303 RepID=UPI001F280CA4|nr:caspase family protein [Dyadobacter sp. CY312]MCE7044392.1 caspase family protein [Dyadobacter sp. CY312]
MKTLAVVIGNNDYHGTAILSNAVADAKAIAEVFNRLGYEVISKFNCSSEGCVELLAEIESKISDFDATIFFFAGHGFEIDGENFLTSIDCQIPPATKYAVSRSSISISELLNIYKLYPNKINIVIIDACRKSFARGTGNVFAPVRAPRGTLIAFSTSPEDGSSDGGFEGGHSVYTGALLTYIGREQLSVEELFKKVRKTVNNLTQGRQTPWEHTSLIGDFYFNIGQLTYSQNLLYSEDVVREVTYMLKPDEFSKAIFEIKSLDWNRQNPAIAKILGIHSSNLTSNQQFILGRNLLQAGGFAYAATNFFEKIEVNLKRFQSGKENHVLNGILFEIYFDNRAEFRRNRFKIQCFDQIISLRKDPIFTNSFSFIATLLSQYRINRVFWIPTSSDIPIDVDVLVSSEKMEDWLGETDFYDVINSIYVMGTNILPHIRGYNLGDSNVIALRKALASYLAAPEDLIQILSNMSINKIGIRPEIFSEEDLDL